MTLNECIFIIADSNANDRQAFKHILQAAGAKKILFVSDDRTAQRELEITRVDQVVFVIYDMETPKLNTVEFARKIRSNWNSPNRFAIIIGISRDVSIDLIHQSRDAGIHGFLVKPISGAKAMGRINQILKELRPFVDSKPYFGPDRRRGEPSNYQGENRRREQKKLIEAPWKGTLERIQEKAAPPKPKPRPKQVINTPESSEDEDLPPPPPPLRRPPPRRPESPPPSDSVPSQAMQWTDMAVEPPKPRPKPAPKPQPEPQPAPPVQEIEEPADPEEKQVVAAMDTLSREAQTLFPDSAPPDMPAPPPEPPPTLASPWAGLERPDFPASDPTMPPRDAMTAAQQSTVVYDTGVPVQPVRMVGSGGPPSRARPGPGRSPQGESEDDWQADDSEDWDAEAAESSMDADSPEDSDSAPQADDNPDEPPSSKSRKKSDSPATPPPSSKQNLHKEAPVSQKELLNTLLNRDSKGQQDHTQTEGSDPGTRPTISQQDLLAALTKRSIGP
ncbi:hypothetical protein JCM17960_28290 [Magnetospira thiophila]